MNYSDLLPVMDELNLYLVSNGLKKSAFIEFDPLDPDFRDSSSNEVWVFKPELVAEFNGLLEGLEKSGVIYFQKLTVNTTMDYCVNNKWTETKRVIESFNIGSSKEYLNELINAKSDEQRGFALDYPPDAVFYYNKLINEEVRNSTYVSVCLAKAKHAGIVIPSWLAYVSFVPEELDIIHNRISRQSRKVGERYQEFVRKNNPDLANRVENHFYDRKLPDSWVKHDGSYLLITAKR